MKLTISPYAYIYIYIWSRPAPGNPPNTNPHNPPQQPHPWGRPAFHHHPSKSHVLYLHPGLVPPMHYMTGYLHEVFTTAYNMPVRCIYTALLPIKYLYSSHILAMGQDLMCYTHTCWPLTTCTLST